MSRRTGLWSRPRPTRLSPSAETRLVVTALRLTFGISDLYNFEQLADTRDGGLHCFFMDALQPNRCPAVAKHPLFAHKPLKVQSLCVTGGIPASSVPAPSTGL